MRDAGYSVLRGMTGAAGMAAGSLKPVTGRGAGSSLIFESSSADRTYAGRKEGRKESVAVGKSC